MCGIFGIAFLKEHNLTYRSDVVKVVRELFKKSEQRGRRASGIALVSQKQINVLKSAMPGSLFIETPEFISLCNKSIRVSKADKDSERTTFILGHCRLDTKGSPGHSGNNHPIVVGKTVGMHNGMITNDDDLYDSFKYSAKFPNRNAEVDSEIIFALIDYYYTKMKYSFLKSLQRAGDELSGGYACAVVNAENPYLIGLFRNYKPIRVLHADNPGIIVFASDMQIVEAALQQINISESRVLKIDQHKAMLIDVKKNEYSIHNLAYRGSTYGYA